SLHLSSFLSGGPSALASGKEFSNSSGHVRMSSRTKPKCSDELANQAHLLDGKRTVTEMLGLARDWAFSCIVGKITLSRRDTFEAIIGT
ncbi:hypothetical protein, partial [Ellagibacter isourolithinifaciens]|uniref:hypothetical protein n=1 Tax=Ellagibacter isourolithinifaciens TaxID=2137581 RepID=UPI003A94F042